MNDPFEVLGLSIDAEPEEVRRKYLQLVREFPPDREPERFAEIRKAYEELADPLARWERVLFRIPDSEAFEALAGDMRRALHRLHCSSDKLLKLAELE